MVLSINQVLLVGHLGKDPTVGSSKGGKNYASLSLATTEYYTDRNNGERKSKTQWHRVVVWNAPLIEHVVPKLKKGVPVLIEGQLEYHDYADPKTNENRSVATISLHFDPCKLIVLVGSDGVAPS